jgi:hypothetical protein
MTGPEHYREAERLLIKSYKVINRYGEAVTPYFESDTIAAAQVHATLALAAATAGAVSDDSAYDWAQVLI